MLAEVALQTRSQLKTGQSVLAVWTGKPNYVRDPQTGLRRFRPGAIIRGRDQEIRANSLGLRSPELARPKPAGEWRIIMLGASTVMGAYARTNDETVPALLQAELNRENRTLGIKVINGGIVGFALEDLLGMLRWAADAVEPDVVIVYSGVNDFAGYCNTPVGSEPKRESWAWPQWRLPGWLLTIELIKKNTLTLRPGVSASTKRVDPDSVDTEIYRKYLKDMVEWARSRGQAIVLTTNARSYRPDQPVDVQLAMSQTARYYNACFDLPALHRLYDIHNGLIERLGRELQVPVVRLGDEMPGGPDYFRDATHPNDMGNRLMARLLARGLQSAGLVRPAAAP